MSNSEMSDHIAYLKARLNYCTRESSYNEQQIIIYREFIQIAEDSADFKEYINKLGKNASFFPVAQAEYADRVSAQLKISKDTGDKKAAASWQKAYDSIIAASDHSAVFNSYEKSRQEAESSKQLLRDQMNTAMELLQLITLWKIEPESGKKGKAHIIESFWNKLKILDPEFEWGSLRHPPYSRFLVYEEERSQILKSYLEQAIGAKV
jgi:hypothetical protein